MTERKLSGLYFVVNQAIRKERIPDIVLSSLRGGVDIVQIICKGKKIDFESLRKLRKITRDFGVPLLCNNSVEIAENFEIDGLHLDEYTLSPYFFKNRFGPKL
jgi:thiamine-phosphate pyrophosphorylase